MVIVDIYLSSVVPVTCIYLNTVVPVTLLGVIAGVTWSMVIGNMTLLQRLKFMGLNVSSNIVLGLLWPVVWPQYVCGGNAKFILDLIFAETAPEK